MPINNPGGGSSLWTVITDTTLAASGRFDVSGIESVYAFLYGTLLVRSDVAATFDFMHIFLNGDTTLTNYRRGSLQGGTSNVSSAAEDSILGELAAASSPDDYFGYIEFTIPFYASTSHEKILTAFTSNRRDATSISTYQIAIHWENSAAITQITVQPDGYATDEFVANSRLALYGVGTA